MNPWIRVVQEMGHWCAALPLLMCFIQLLRKRDPSPDAWLLSGAFFISVIADTIGAQLAKMGLSNHWISYTYTPIQFGLFVAILLHARAMRVVALLFLLTAAVVSATHGKPGVPETIVQVLWGGAVGGIVLGNTRLGRYMPALLIYCWAAIPFRVVMGWATPALDGPWIFSWSTYQLVRVTAMILMSIAIIQQPVLRLLEAHEPGASKPARGWRGALHLAERDSDTAVAKARRKAG